MFSSRPAQHLFPSCTAIQDAAFGVIDWVVGVNFYIRLVFFGVVNHLLEIKVVGDFCQGGGKGDFFYSCAAE